MQLFYELILQILINLNFIKYPQNKVTTETLRP